MSRYTRKRSAYVAQREANDGALRAAAATALKHHPAITFLYTSHSPAGARLGAKTSVIIPDPRTRCHKARCTRCEAILAEGMLLGRVYDDPDDLAYAFYEDPLPMHLYSLATSLWSYWDSDVRLPSDPVETSVLVTRDWARQGKDLRINYNMTARLLVQDAVSMLTPERRRLDAAKREFAAYAKTLHR